MSKLVEIPPDQLNGFQNEKHTQVNTLNVSSQQEKTGVEARKHRSEDLKVISGLRNEIATYKHQNQTKDAMVKKMSDRIETLTGELGAIRCEMRDQLEDVRNEMRDQLEDVRNEMRDHLEDVRNEMRDQLEDIRNEMRGQFNALNAMMQQLVDNSNAAMQSN